MAILTVVLFLLIMGIIIWEMTTMDAKRKELDKWGTILDQMNILTFVEKAGEEPFRKIIQNIDSIEWKFYKREVSELKKLAQLRLNIKK